MENPYEYTELSKTTETAKLPIPVAFVFEETEPKHFSLRHVIGMTATIMGSIMILQFIILLFLISVVVIDNFGWSFFGESYRLELFVVVTIIAFGNAYIFILIFYSPYICSYNFFDRIFSIDRKKPFEGMRCRFIAYPSRNKGIRKFMEITDDIGWVNTDEGGIRFKGDHTELFIPGEMIDALVYTDKAKKPLIMRYIRQTQINLKPYEGIPFEAVIFIEMESRKLTEVLKMRRKLRQMFESLDSRF